MRIISGIFSFFLYATMGATFFAGGFLTCYILFPPRPPSFNAYPATIGALTTTMAYDDPSGIPSNTYARRQTMLNNNRTPSSKDDHSILDEAQEEARHDTLVMTQNTLDHVLEEWSQRLREKLGPIFGAAVVPLTSGLARDVVDRKLAEQRKVKDTTEPDLQSPSTRTHNDASTASKADTTTAVPGRYTVQLQNYSENNNALAAVRELQQRNFSAYVVRLMAGSEVNYSVRVGSFATFQEAQDAARLVREMSGQPARVVMVERSWTSIPVHRDTAIRSSHSQSISMENRP